MSDPPNLLIGEVKNQSRQNQSSSSFTREDLGQPSQRPFPHGIQGKTHLNSATSHANPAAPFPGVSRQHQEGYPWHIPAASLQLHGRISNASNPYNHHYSHISHSTSAPLTAYPKNAMLESVHTHGIHSQGCYGTPLSPNAASMPFHPQHHPQFRVPAYPTFTTESNSAPTIYANTVGIPDYDPTPSNPVHALQPPVSLAPMSQPSTAFSIAITAPPSPVIPPSAATLNAANVGGQGVDLHLSPSSVRGSGAATSYSPPPLEEPDEMDEESPPLSLPAAPCSPLPKQGPKCRKIMDDVPLEMDIDKLQQRLESQGGEKDAIARVPAVFAKGVSKDALRLRRRKTGPGGKSMNFDQGYLNFVGRRQVKKGDRTDVYYENEWWCRLCPPGDRTFYVAFKNLQPHLCSKHFGLPGRGKNSG